MTREIVLYLFNTLDNEDVRYCILRNYEGLPDDLGGHDIDILVDRKDKKIVHKILRTIQDKFNARWIRVGERQYVISYYLSYKEGTELVLLQIDFFYAMDWHGRTLLSGEYILDNRIQYNGFYIPRPAHEAITSLFSSLIRGGFYKEKYHSTIKKLIASDKDEFMYSLNKSIGGYSTELVNAIENDEIEVCEALVPNMRQKITNNCFRTHPIKTGKDMLLFLIWEIRNRICYAGNTFAVVGINKEIIIDCLVKLIFKYYKNEEDAKKYIVISSSIPMSKIGRIKFYLKNVLKKLNKTYAIVFVCSDDVVKELTPIKPDSIMTFGKLEVHSAIKHICLLNADKEISDQVEHNIIDTILRTDKSIYKNFIYKEGE